VISGTSQKARSSIQKTSVSQMLIKIFSPRANIMKKLSCEEEGVRVGRTSPLEKKNDEMISKSSIYSHKKRFLPSLLILETIHATRRLFARQI
jgi:hypothetical protein